MVNAWAKRIAANVCTWLGDSGAPPFGQFPILTYHRIAPCRQGAPRATWNVPPDRFREQLSGLLERDFEPVRLSRVLSLQQAGHDPPSKCFVVTFDDAYQTTFTNALPILRDLRIPATVFIATKYVDSGEPFPFDDWEARGRSDLVEDWLPQTRQALDEALDKETEEPLIEFGSHGHRHRQFGDDVSAFREDLELSFEILRACWSVTNPAYSFPYGAYNQALLESAQEAGARCAVTSDPNPANTGSTPWGWGRFGMHDWDTAETVLTRASGVYARIRSIYQTRRRGVSRSQPSSRP